MLKLNRFISMTSPVGTWEPSQLIGARVKIKSMSLRSSLFGFDSDSIYVISDIGFRMSKLGKAYGIVYLDGFGTKEFVWKDLEILSLDTTLYKKAICGQFCCGGSLVGWQITLDDFYDNMWDDGDDLTNPEENETGEDGDLLD